MHNSPIVNSFLLHGLSFIFTFCPDLLHQLQEGKKVYSNLLWQLRKPDEIKAGSSHAAD